MYAPVRTVHHERVSACTFAPGGETYYTAGNGGTVRVWDVDAGESRIEWVAHEGGIEDLSATGAAAVASAGADGTVRLWQSNTGDCDAMYDDHTDVVTAVAATS